MTAWNETAGLAALSICDSLLLALSERNILPETEIIGLLRDAAAAHESAPSGADPARHAEVAALINALLDRRIGPKRR
jgi:hypothetical protein